MIVSRSASRSRRRVVVGLSAGGHDSACCLMIDGRVAVAVAEERLTRVRHDPRVPVRAFRACLDHARLTPTDVALVAVAEDPHARRARQERYPVAGWTIAELPSPESVEHAIRSRLGHEGPIRFFHHHNCHAASAYLLGPFRRAAILTLDGVGEWRSGILACGRENRISILQEIRFPHSLGLFYATVTAYLGFEVASGEGKVMGLAAYGTPRFADPLRGLISIAEDGRLKLDLSAFDYHRGGPMYSQRLADLLGRPPRGPDAPIEAFHQDVAASAQEVLVEALLTLAGVLARRTGMRDLCFAGGVALNCSAVGRLRQEGPFRKIHIPPAPDDSGTAMGAAALADIELTGRPPEELAGPYLGPRVEDHELRGLLARVGFELSPRDDEDVVPDIVERLIAGQVVAWYEGRSEFGPRALGARSILADPRRQENRDRVNRIKGRELFRPLAPSVLEAEASRWFDISSSPWMTAACRVLRPSDLPAVTHVDGTARPQTVAGDAPRRFRSLLAAFFERTGCPVLLNTSFNIAGEPIVAGAVDALRTFCASSLDALVLDGWLIDRRDVGDRQVPPGRDDRASVFATTGPLAEGLYTFV